MRIIRKSITELTRFQKKEIDEFIDQNNGLIFHGTKFNEIASEAFNSHLSYFLAYDGNKLIGVCPVHSIKRGILTDSYSNNGSFEIPYGGWVYEKAAFNFKIVNKKTKLKFNENLTMFTSFFHSDGLENNRLKTFQTALINLRLSEEDILSKIVSANTRHNIRRAPKKGVRIIEITDILVFIKLYGTLKNAINRKVEKENQKFIEQIFSEYYRESKIFILGAVYREEIISTVLCVGNRNVFHAYIAGRIAELPKNIYQNERLWWHCILHAKYLGANSFDLCVIQPELLPHIAQFKMGFTKELTPFYCLIKKPLSFKVLNKIQNVLPS